MMVYLASPYTHYDPFVVHNRYMCAALAVAQLTTRDCTVISPIVLFHIPSQLLSLPKDATFYQAVDDEILVRCDELWVLCLPGWIDSIGVNHELELAKNKNMKIRYVASYKDSNEGKKYLFVSLNDAIPLS